MTNTEIHEHVGRSYVLISVADLIDRFQRGELYVTYLDLEGDEYADPDGDDPELAAFYARVEFAEWDDRDGAECFAADQARISTDRGRFLFPVGHEVRLVVV